MYSKQPNKSQDNQPQGHDTIAVECKMTKEKEKKEKGDPEKQNTNLPSPANPSTSFIAGKVCKLNSFLESMNLDPQKIMMEIKLEPGKIMRALEEYAKKESSDEECSTFRSKDEEYAMAVRDFKKFFKRRDVATQIILLENVQNHQKTRTKEIFVGGSWSDSSEEDDEKVKNEMCLVAQASSEEPDEWIKDSGCSKHMTGNRKLFTSYKAYNEGNVIFGSNLHHNNIGKGLWYPKGTGIETVVYANSDHVGDYADQRALAVFVHSWDVG
nr:hypothetical protein [Tanacetum cinerariifolium]